MPREQMLSFDTRVSHISKDENGILVDVASNHSSKKYVIPIEDLFEDADSVEVTDNYDIEATWNGITHTMTVPDYLKPSYARTKSGKNRNNSE